MSDYTPTTEQVREAVSLDGAVAVEPDAFDRWLAEHDRETAEAEAARHAPAWDEDTVYDEAKNAVIVLERSHDIAHGDVPDEDDYVSAILAVVRHHLPVSGESRAQVRLEALREMWDAVDARMLKLAEGGTYPNLVEDLANLLTAVQTELDGGPRWADRPVAEGGDDHD